MTALQPEITALIARQQRLAEGIAAEARHQMDPAEIDVETAFTRLACEHPKACSCDSNYPGWTPGGAA
ncbi:hypothetical protein L0F81_25160 [Streptomyces tricolor]|uniref:Uncharacterized protein n=1 Tax=Streptomyces tricolor TaxID=68277 RepID=A0ABS9JLU4_9ACTN|nr:hypothetical protein [Streptomyces tricolor]MCG0066532.1 hypothetical protein [Streptomyces tricolor]